jgi:hypothetical protein
MKFIRFFGLLLIACFTPSLLHAQDNLLITEFLAENDRGLRDEDGDEQDWLEIYNAGTNTVNLANWYLTDNPANRDKWRFPATNLLANRYMIVFCSEKNRRTPGEPLHTNFRLDKEGEFLALVWTNGTTIVSQYSPAYPQQAADVSYGMVVDQRTIPLVTATSAAKVFVPVDDTLSSNWIEIGFNDADWNGVTPSIGFESQSPAPVVVADSAADFSGIQGQDNWFYGYYNRTHDTNAPGYHATNFIAFPNDTSQPWSDDNFWTGVQWDWFQGNPPWTEVGRTNVHPNGGNSGVEHWAIRRWVSEVAGTIRVDWFLAKANVGGGDGVTGRIFHNNTLRDSVLIPFNNSAGTNRSVVITGVQPGDSIDVALDPTGTGGQPGTPPNDSADGSYMSARITIVPSYTNQFASSVEGQMLNQNATAYLRIPFTVTNLSAIEFLTLRMKYDDGFAAYLNGQPLVSRNAPLEPQWNSTATAERSNLDGVIFEEIDLTPGIDLLRAGTNVLAIQGLNLSAGDSDFLCVAELRGASLTLDPNVRRHFVVPTPGAPNGVGTTNLGPLLFDVEFTPNEPSDNEPIVVTAATRMTLNPVGAVTLTYRIMFSNDVTVPMFDDGAHGDGPAGDGVYGATIPANASTIGEMVRWFVRAFDSISNVTRFPPFQSPNNSPQYMGTMVHNPFLTNPLPVLHMFIPSNTLASAGNDSNGRYPASLYYLGEFYDNVGMNRHGQSSSGFPRRSYDIDFNPGYNFRYDPNEDRVDDINLLTTYPDKAKMRNMLSYQIYKDAGGAYHFVYPIRVQHNGIYYADYHLVENGDDNYLKRLKLDPRGALYKMYNTFQDISDTTLVPNVEAEKKTRKQEGNEDLVSLFSGMVLTPAGLARNNFMFDNINIPATINFLAARIITGDVDCCHKNYYFYRDSDGTGEWTGLPWDVDLSFGRNWNSTSTYWDDTMYPNNGLGVGGNNGVFGPLLSHPQTQQMYWRRIRTLMDELLQPTNTPASQLNFERQIRYWRDLIAPDAELEKTRWPTWGGTASTPSGEAIISTCCTQSVAHAADILMTNYLPARRISLYGRSPNPLPAAQPSNAVVRIGAIEYNPSNGNQAQEYIQFTNANNYAVDMSFWAMTGAVRYTFPGGTVIPANSVMYLSPNVVQFRRRTLSPRGSQSLLVVGNYDGQLSARGETLHLVDRGGRPVFTNGYPGTPSLPQRFLRVTEIMYHPPNPPAGATYVDDDLEYIELKNIGGVPMNLIGVHFTNGIEFRFTATNAVTNLAAGQSIVLVKNLAAFTSVYGSGPTVAGVYTGSLDNNGETIRLDDAVNEKILDFRYENNWYPSTDGAGFSLVIVDENAPYYTWDLKSSWRPSGHDFGSPGGGDFEQPMLAVILVNEVFTHSDPAPPYDFIELYNPNTEAVHIGGWFISDDFEFPKKYRIPNGTTIAAGGYIVFDETQFNADTNLPTSFSFSSRGDEAYVFSGDGTNLTGFFHGFRFGAAENGVSFGRYTMSTGAVHFVAQNTRTPAAANDLPKVGPVVISEIMYHPPDLAGGVDDGDMEFVELHNLTMSDVPLFENGASWRIRGGVDFDFPSTATVPAGGYAIVVPFHPLDPPRAAAFRNRYGLAGDVPLYGPYGGKLDNSLDRVELQRPDLPDDDGTPYILVEEVEYADVTPWPPIADGVGPSLQRLEVSEYGNDAINWTSVIPTANGPYPGGALPVIVTHPTNTTAVATLSTTFTVEATSESAVAFQWFHGDSVIPGGTSPTLQLNNLKPSDAGIYWVVVYNGAGSVNSSNATLTVLIPASITQQPQSTPVIRGSTNEATYGQSTNTVVFSVTATSNSDITYQWRFNGDNIDGATNSTLVLNNVSLADNGSYDCVVTDAVGPIVSQPATLTVAVQPFFTRHPQPITALQGETVTFNVLNRGTEPFGYRWRRSSVNLYSTNGGVTYFPSLTLFNVSSANAGLYTVVVTNAALAGGVLSQGGSLTVQSDFDGDGAGDLWEIQNGFMTNAMSTDGFDDTDGDGMTNAQEFRAGTNPNDPASVLKVTQFTAGEPATIRFVAVANRSYTLQFTDDVSSGNWSNLAHMVSRTTNRTETVTDPAPGPSRYYRLVTPFQE